MSYDGEMLTRGDGASNEQRGEKPDELDQCLSNEKLFPAAEKVESIRGKYGVKDGDIACMAASLLGELGQKKLEKLVELYMQKEQKQQAAEAIYSNRPDLRPKI